MADEVASSGLMSRVGLWSEMVIYSTIYCPGIEQCTYSMLAYQIDH